MIASHWVSRTAYEQSGFFCCCFPLKPTGILSWGCTKLTENKETSPMWHMVSQSRRCILNCDIMTLIRKQTIHATCRNDYLNTSISKAGTASSPPLVGAAVEPCSLCRWTHASINLQLPTSFPYNALSLCLGLLESPKICVQSNLCFE
jgi:hypothetical protein